MHQFHLWETLRNNRLASVHILVNATSDAPKPVERFGMPVHQRICPRDSIRLERDNLASRLDPGQERVLFKQAVPQYFWGEDPSNRVTKPEQSGHPEHNGDGGLGYLTPLTPFPACPHSLQSEKKENPTSLPPRQGETTVDGLNAVLPLHQYCPKNQHLTLRSCSTVAAAQSVGEQRAPTWMTEQWTSLLRQSQSRETPPRSASTWREWIAGRGPQITGRAGLWGVSSGHGHSWRPCEGTAFLISRHESRVLSKMRNKEWIFQTKEQGTGWNWH